MDQNQALLVMDFQPAVLAAVGGDDAPALGAAVRAAKAARAAGLPVVFVRVAFRPGYPEVNPANKGFAALAQYGDIFDEEGPATIVHPALERARSEPLITKRRVSPFAGSDLGALLGGLGADHLVLAGVVTSGVVLSTLRHASDADYRLTVLSDACADPDDEVHDVLMRKLFPQHADVTTVDAWVAGL